MFIFTSFIKFGMFSATFFPPDISNQFLNSPIHAVVSECLSLVIPGSQKD